MPRIFISYRRADSAEITEKIYQRFVARFGKRNVFKDVNSIPIGKDFRAVIEEELITCDMMLVIIGSSWLNITDAEGKRRLDNPEDAVRTEVELGLRHVQVIPVMVGGAPIPPEDELPRRLSQLIFQNAAFVRDDDFERDVQKLIETIAPRRRIGRRIGALLAVALIVVAGSAFAAFNAAQQRNSFPTEAAQSETATSQPSAAPQLVFTETSLPLSSVTTTSASSTLPATATNQPLTTATETPKQFVPITVNNAQDLDIGLAEPGACLALAPRGRLFVTDQGYVRALSNEVDGFYITHYNDFLPTFSPDGSVLAASNVGVYDVASAQLRFSLPNVENAHAYPVFSPSGALLAVDGDGVYDVASGQKRFSFSTSNKIPGFSVNGLLLAAANGLYDTASGQKRFTPSTFINAFSPNSALLAVNGDGVYDVASGQKRFAIRGFNSAVFSPDSSLLAVDTDGVYDVASGQKRFAFDGFGNTPVFSPNGLFVAEANVGVYDVSTGQKRFTIGGVGLPVFNPDGSLLVVEGDGVYDVAGGKLIFKNPWTRFAGSFISDYFLLQSSYQSCLVLGPKSDPWAYIPKNLAITLAPAYIHVEPDASTAIKDTLPTSTLLLLSIYSPDNQWVSVGTDAWIQASYVKLLHSP
jgi:hypothetical protein